MRLKLDIYTSGSNLKLGDKQRTFGILRLIIARSFPKLGSFLSRISISRCMQVETPPRKKSAILLATIHLKLDLSCHLAFAYTQLSFASLFCHSNFILLSP